MDKGIVVFITTPSEEEAVLIGQHLVEEHLAACANIISGLRSLFWWEGKICDENEILIFVKSHQKHLTRLVTRVKELHSYDVPEVIALPIIGGSEDYLKWMEESLS